MYSSDYIFNEPSTATFDFSEFFTGASIALLIFGIFLILIILAIVILVVIANCKVFKKAGEAWWKGLIPLYSSWVETRIVGLAWWWFLIFAGLTAFAGVKGNFSYVVYWGIILTSFNYNFNLAKKFGKSNGFAFLNTILPVIGLPILAFGSSQYNKDAEVDENGIFSVKK